MMEDMIGALEALRGMQAVRTVTKAGQQAVNPPAVRPIVSGLLRLFGATPATLLSRWNDFSKRASRGIDFAWQYEGANGGRLTVRFPRENMPRSAFVSFESGCWLMLELCGSKGVVAATEIVERGTTGIIRVVW